MKTLKIENFDELDDLDELDDSEDNTYRVYYNIMVRGYDEFDRETTDNKLICVETDENDAIYEASTLEDIPTLKDVDTVYVRIEVDEVVCFQDFEDTVTIYSRVKIIK